MRKKGYIPSGDVIMVLRVFEKFATIFLKANIDYCSIISHWASRNVSFLLWYDVYVVFYTVERRFCVFPQHAVRRLERGDFLDRKPEHCRST